RCFIADWPPTVGGGGCDLLTCPPATNLLPTAKEVSGNVRTNMEWQSHLLKGKRTYTDTHGSYLDPPKVGGSNPSPATKLNQQYRFPFVYKGKRETSNLRRMLVFLFMSHLLGKHWAILKKPSVIGTYSLKS
ncbi:MAG: hypothetical protein CL718_00175, partial [Chloroflexi bacterium]|nr:hypothetical protein [Chloroflexota bacterium]